MMKMSLLLVLLVFGCFNQFQAIPLAHLNRIISEVASGILCDACLEMMSKIRELVERKESEFVIVETAIGICELYKSLIKTNFDDRVCKMIVPQFKDEVLYVFDHTALSSREICGTILFDKCGVPYRPFHQNWSVPIPGDKPPIKPYHPPTANITNRILHISDIHWDPLYTPGLQANCDEPLCCRPPLPKGTPGNSAGYWGEPQCDTPNQTLVNLMEHLNDTSDQFEWIYLTGDLPAHNIWDQTKSGQVFILKKIISLFDEYLPNKPLFYAIGNHESDPVNSFPPSFVTEYSMSWLYDATADALKRWLPSPDAINTFKSGGYYSIDFEGLRIISLQTNYYNNLNWWLLINSTDPDGMLQWFTEKLLDAEKKGMKVHVLGHIPPGDDPWGQNYKKIILRFENTVAGQFFAHYHFDSFKVLIDFEAASTPRPYSVLYLGPSVTTYPGQNAGYRIYTVDGDYNDSSRQVLDHETYILNITDANLTNKPKWIHEYTAKDAYNMTDLTPKSWLALSKEFTTNNELFLKYYHYFSKSFNMESQCSDSCQDSTICSLLATFSSISACDAIAPNLVAQEEMVLYAAAHEHC